MRRLLLWLALFSLLVAGSVLAQDATPETTPAAGAWEQINVEGAVCARGTPYSFFAHAGDPDKLMVYFQGGGACWGGSTCKPGGTFDDTVEPDEIDRYRGIFDFADPQNPVADYSIVFIAYCTGDVHTGAQTRDFTEGGDEFTIAFDGFTNAQAVLDWTYEHYTQPSELIVTGSSAGAYGAVFNAPYLLAHYPDARAFVFGDAGIGVTAPEWDGLETWGTLDNAYDGAGYGSVGDSEFANDLFQAGAAAFPNARFAAYTSATDQVQAGFYILQGGAEDWSAAMLNKIAALDTLDNFNSYIGWGATHTILATPLFYQMQVGGVSFRDWFVALVAGEPAENILCEDCDTAEIAPGR